MKHANIDLCDFCFYEAVELMDFEVQSDETTTHFVDSVVGEQVGLDVGYDGVSASDMTPSVDLQEFLKRPVRIRSFTWLEADPVGTLVTANPWYLFFNDARIKYKLNNYSFISCKLKIKVMVNASPFYYGAMLMTYRPLTTFKSSTIIADAATRYFIPLSQRPHLWILPQEESCDEMVLPYLNHKNWLDAQSSTDLLAFGELEFRNFTALQSANGAVGTGVSVQVYAWAEDVKLSGPTVGLAVQSDEYGNGVVSAPASAISNGAAWFENIPVIGRFATATRIGASAVSKIATLFGFTNVPDVSDCTSVRPSAFPRLATTQVSYPYEKLTLDEKNELTIDPSVLGMEPKDELAIGNLVTRESYLTTFTWDSTNITDDTLFAAAVSPNMYDTDGAAQAKLFMTPMHWAGMPFDSWRGDIIFRFHFVASKYHKGRMRFTFDPTGTAAQNIISDAVSQTVCFTQIIDLGAENDVEIRVPYQQATAWLQNLSGYLSAGKQWQTSGFSYLHTIGVTNGTITARVATILTGPTATANVPVMVFVRGAENLEFASPANIGLSTFSQFAVQADEVYGTPSKVVAGCNSNALPDRYLLNFGESVKSIRQIMRRSALSYVSKVVGDNVSQMLLYRENFSRFPLQPGFDPAGIHTATKLVGVGNTTYNYTFHTPQTWFAPAFLCQKGSVQWVFNTSSKTPYQSVRVLRNPVLASNASNAKTTGVALGVSGVSKYFQTYSNSGLGGQALINQITNAGISVQLPNYTIYRFQSTDATKASAPTSIDGGSREMYQLELYSDPALNADQAASMSIFHYTSVGTDYNLYYFLNTPTITVYSAVPVAV